MSKTVIEGDKKKGRAKRLILAVLLVLLGLAAVLYAGWQFSKKTVASAVDGTEVHGTLPEEVKQETLPEYNGKNVLGILVCGMAYDLDEDGNVISTDAASQNTDLVLYVYYDIDAGTMNVLSLMRDTYVGDELATGSRYRINALYRNAEDADNRMSALASAIYDQYKLPVDYYVTIDMNSLKELVAVVNNLHVYVPVDVTDPKTGNTIEEGWQWLDPDQVEFVVRNRTSPTYGGQSDFARTQVQLNVISSLFRLFKTLTPLDAVKWGNIGLQYVKTDMPVDEILGLMQRMLQITAEDICFVRPSYGGVVYRGEDILVLQPEPLAELLNTYFRPEGVQVAADELNIPQVEYNPGNVYEESIKTLDSVEADAPPMPEGSAW